MGPVLENVLVELLVDLPTDAHGGRAPLPVRPVDRGHQRARRASHPPAVVTRKVCGGNRTRKGADTQQVLASVVRTPPPAQARPAGPDRNDAVRAEAGRPRSARPAPAALLSRLPRRDSAGAARHPGTPCRDRVRYVKRTCLSSCPPVMACHRNVPAVPAASPLRTTHRPPSLGAAGVHCGWGGKRIPRAFRTQQAGRCSPARFREHQRSLLTTGPEGLDSPRDIARRPAQPRAAEGLQAPGLAGRCFFSTEWSERYHL